MVYSDEKRGEAPTTRRNRQEPQPEKSRPALNPTIVIIGAGSVVFTRELLGDILSFPELRRGPGRAARHRRRAAGDRRGDRARTAAQLGATPKIVAAPRPRAALDGADYVINVDPGRRARGAPCATSRSRPGTGCARPSATRRHRRHLPGAAHLPGAGRHRRRHARGVPGRVAAQLHQPDGDERHLPGRGRPDLKVRRAVPLGLLDGATGCARCRRAVRRGRLLRPRASTTRRGCCAGSASGENLYPLLDAAHRGRPASCAGGCGSTCTAGSATTRPRPASTPPSTCPGTCTTPARSSGCGSPSATYVRHQRGEPRPSTQAPRAQLARRTAARDRCRQRRSTHRRSSTASRPAPAASSRPTSPTLA